MDERGKLDPRTIERDLPTGFPFKPVIVIERLESTNTALMEGARGGRYAPGTVLAAEEQTTGRGRMKRPWASVPHRSLTFSVLAPNPLPESPGFISVGAALSLAAAVEELTGLTASVKWPNDVYIGAGKTAGILAEAVQLEGGHFAVVGFGINVNATPDISNRNERLSVTSLREASGMDVDRSRLLRAVLTGFAEVLETIGRGDRAAIADGLRGRSLLIGRTARFQRSNERYEGQVAGHTDDLGIILDTAAERITLPGEGTELLDLFPPRKHP
jgi:BirA family biotin operon repressor/biotin-[acetyl-CoA-carboxylase] ligase